MPAVQEEGLEAFTRYLRQIAAEHAQQGYRDLVEGGARLWSLGF